jgi:hypothetical protein
MTLRAVRYVCRWQQQTSLLSAGSFSTAGLLTHLYICIKTTQDAKLQRNEFGILFSRKRIYDLEAYGRTRDYVPVRLSTCLILERTGKHFY